MRFMYTSTTGLKLSLYYKGSLFLTRNPPNGGLFHNFGSFLVYATNTIATSATATSASATDATDLSSLVS